MFNRPPPVTQGRTHERDGDTSTRAPTHAGRDDLVWSSGVWTLEINVKGGPRTVRLQCVIYSDTPNLPNSPQASKAPRVLLL